MLVFFWNFVLFSIFQQKIPNDKNDDDDDDDDDDEDDYYYYYYYYDHDTVMVMIIWVLGKILVNSYKFLDV